MRVICHSGTHSGKRPQEWIGIVNIQELVNNGEATLYGDGFLIWTGNTPRFITAEEAGN